MGRGEVSSNEPGDSKKVSVVGFIFTGLVFGGGGARKDQNELPWDGAGGKSFGFPEETDAVRWCDDVVLGAPACDWLEAD